MIERRTYHIAEMRVAGKDKPEITGHAAVFNQKSEEMMGFREIILPGAFAKTLKTADVRALWNHDPNYVLGRNKSGTLILDEDELGLRVKIFPPDTVFANDMLETIRRGDVDQMSFGFFTVKDEFRSERGEIIRELHEVELFDVSPVTYPAYPQTDVQAREARDYFSQRIKNIVPAKTEDVLKIRAKNAELREAMTKKLWL